MSEAKTTMPGRESEAGRTLIEMAVVFMMIGVVLGFTIPVVANSIRAYNLRNTAERLAERLAAGRALAMSKNKNVTISFTSAGQYGYDFSPAGAPDGTPDSSDPNDPSQSYYVETLPSGMSGSVTNGGVTLTNGKGITYTSRGELPIGASQVDIVLTSASKTATVSVNLRGQVWVH
ncbi:MAG TPA: GspH/FimT family pseudopilin [Blastocatellia bacterium]|nr:GspH/FimT family pseudopilin [Blastocatellia bacterium]